MNDTTGLKKKRVSGWLSIKDPEDLQKALVRMLNKILALRWIVWVRSDRNYCLCASASLWLG